MSKIVGLDLGTNSIGWATIDNSSNKIIDCGIRMLPSSSDNKRRLARPQGRLEDKSVHRTLLD